MSNLLFSEPSCSMRAAAARILCGFVIIPLAACAGSSSEPPPPPPGAIASGEPIGSSSITGRVVFGGPPPERRPINMSGEAACRKSPDMALTEDLIVGPDGGVKNAYVRIVSGLGELRFAPPTVAAQMDQRGCMFEPHLLPVQTNQIVEFTSSDPVLHNVRAKARKNPTFNLSMPGRGRSVRRFFSAPEMIGIRCDIHAWMSAYVAVSDHPFHAVTDDRGAFTIDGLPGGTYEIEVWHESLGTSIQTATLTQGERRQLDFSLSK